MKFLLKDNGIDFIDATMHSTHNGGISVVAERFIRTFKNKLYNYMS